MKPLVVITGASSGIGLACAKYFADKNYPLLILARRKEILDNLNLPNTITARVDVRDFNQLNEAVKHAESVYGPVDLLINNAGIMPMDQYVDQSLEDKYNTLDVNIKGVINGMDAVLPSMLKQNHGTIVNISSVAGRYTYSDHSVYNGSKFAVNAITEQVRRELSDTNIRFSLIEPAIVDTNLLSTTKNQSILDSYLARKNSLNGGLKPEQLAEVIYYIYSLPQDVVIPELMISHTNQKV
ncbi:SDR family oxidoreductase [Mycoplasma feriruminatoris]|uniref:NADP-dependent 3-hydroxy acid dehydrogenase YdfG n=1 Tax=Mycoplasma feriruminatoris TaxID=1179777 RepID=A0A654IIX9_9MOLU|nr:SDR family oxidoreductase [Mycoplasma feriruminatoris]WFQ91165.1 oxidoreductase [Mycoplasma feriruminatoris]WFQ91987.1 NADP-dependent 3-hydroxy acid dehydrogenase YdfG [Mycoplasma feriruminatoris]WFQ92828.1 NADP-dependent 3-hydroxy acid dehydrogenase YdfG [Mycoplasma feriruminatoris]WFQ94513.1 NADP-dependent 3-hydroxy acid dehydrogenase YdfG [Mycoplasma feriruminatoris]WFQ95336.1 oxidoreductase [Mycoplasma feriruminatoris]